MTSPHADARIRARTFVVCAVYTLVFGALVALALHHWWGGGVPAWVFGVCAAPACALVLVTFLGDRGRDAFTTRQLAVMLMLPPLLVVWAAESDAPPRATPTAHGAYGEALDFERVFRGSSMAQDAQIAGVERMRSAVFPDGSALLLRRYADEDGARRALTFEVESLSGSARSIPDDAPACCARRGFSFGGGAEGVSYAERHGRDLLRIQARDMAGVIARIATQQLPMPSADDAAAPAPVPVARWPLVCALLALHLFAFIGYVYWAGAVTTRIEPTPGSTPIDLRRLLTYMAALPGAGLSCEVSELDPRTLRVSCGEEDGRRTLRVTLRVDEAARVVRVQEFAGLHGAAPRTSREADMRGVGEPSYDPSRPRAKALYGRAFQTRFIEPELLASWRPDFQDETVSFSADARRKMPSDDVVHALCGIVTHAGYAWQPVFRLAQHAR